MVEFAKLWGQPPDWTAEMSQGGFDNVSSGIGGHRGLVALVFVTRDGYRTSKAVQVGVSHG